MLEITPNAAYGRYIERWNRVDDIVDGESRLKEADLNSITKGIYLRLINTDDISKRNQDKNREFIRGAVLYNATDRTLSGLMGMLYRKQPELPEFEAGNLLADIVDNVDGSGLSLEQQSQSVSAGVIKNGRRGLLTDMPRNDDGSVKTRADVRNGFRPMIKEYSAGAIVDWYDGVINGANKLTMLVLLEYFDVLTGSMGIERDTKKRYLVYKLTTDGVTLEVYSESEDQGLAIDGELLSITGANNQKLDRIPFSFVGSKNNNSNIDSIPLEPVANVNFGHYQESANLSQSSFSLSAVQPWIASDQYHRYMQEKINGGGVVETGSDEIIVVEAGGSFNYASPPPNTMSQSIQKDYEAQMVASGAQLITGNGSEKTAEEARINRSSEASDLTIISANVTNAYNERIKDACLMVGITWKEEYSFKMNDSFFDTAIDTAKLAELVKTWQAGGISKSVLDYNMQQGKVIKHDENLDKMNEAIANESGAPLEFED